MCAIVDNDVRHEVFSPDSQTKAGKFFLDWLDEGNGRLVVGGKLWRELSEYGHFQKWFQVAITSSRAFTCKDDEVDDKETEIRSMQICRSNDEHVLALALVSGARLLFTNDLNLQQDFRNRAIIHSPRGKIYTTVKFREVRKVHQDLLNRTDLCSKLRETR